MADQPSAPTLLIVEDTDRALCAMLSDLFLDGHYHVDVAHDRWHGLRRDLARGYDTVGADRHLPVMDGAQLVGLLRSRGLPTPAPLPAGDGDGEPSQPEAALLVVLMCAPPRKLGHGIVRTIPDTGYRLGVE